MIIFSFDSISLQLPLKRFRGDNDNLISSLPSSLITTDHVYRHGQPTPPSPGHMISRLNNDVCSAEIYIYIYICTYVYVEIIFIFEIFRIHMSSMRMKNHLHG